MSKEFEGQTDGDLRAERDRVVEEWKKLHEPTKERNAKLVRREMAINEELNKRSREELMLLDRQKCSHCGHAGADVELVQFCVGALAEFDRWLCPECRELLRPKAVYARTGELLMRPDSRPSVSEFERAERLKDKPQFCDACGDTHFFVRKPKRDVEPLPPATVKLIDGRAAIRDAIREKFQGTRTGEFLAGYAQKDAEFTAKVAESGDLAALERRISGDLQFAGQESCECPPGPCELGCGCPCTEEEGNLPPSSIDLVCVCGARASPGSSFCSGHRTTGSCPRTKTKSLCECGCHSKGLPKGVTCATVLHGAGPASRRGLTELPPLLQEGLEAIRAEEGPTGTYNEKLEAGWRELTHGFWVHEKEKRIFVEEGQDPVKFRDLQQDLDEGNLGLTELQQVMGNLASETEEKKPCIGCGKEGCEKGYVCHTCGREGGHPHGCPLEEHLEKEKQQKLVALAVPGAFFAKDEEIIKKGLMTAGVANTGLISGEPTHPVLTLDETRKCRCVLVEKEQAALEREEAEKGLGYVAGTRVVVGEDGKEHRVPCSCPLCRREVGRK